MLLLVSSTAHYSLPRFFFGMGLRGCRQAVGWHKPFAWLVPGLVPGPVPGACCALGVPVAGPSRGLCLGLCQAQSVPGPVSVPCAAALAPLAIDFESLRLANRARQTSTWPRFNYRLSPYPLGVRGSRRRPSVKGPGRRASTVRPLGLVFLFPIYLKPACLPTYLLFPWGVGIGSPLWPSPPSLGNLGFVPALHSSSFSPSPSAAGTRDDVGHTAKKLFDAQ